MKIQSVLFFRNTGVFACMHPCQNSGYQDIQNKNFTYFFNGDEILLMREGGTRKILKKYNTRIELYFQLKGKYQVVLSKAIVLQAFIAGFEQKEE